MINNQVRVKLFKKEHFSFLVIGIILLTILPIPKAWAKEGDTLVSDTFSDGNLDGWTVLSGNWYINPQGNLAGSNSGVMLGGRIATGNSEWDNYKIDLDINGFQGIDGFVGFRYSSSNNLYELNLRFGTGFNNTPQAILKKTENGVTTTIGDTHSLTLIDQKWYHLKIETENEKIKIWIDNNLIFDITDTNTKVKKGTLTLGYWTGAIGVAYMKFDNVSVTALAPPPPIKTPVIFIPGIGGSELKASGDIIWSKSDGHGGTYSHAYTNNEKIWVNQDEAVKIGDDDYFDVLRLKTDGVSSEANLALTGNLTSFGYGDIDNFFQGLGYIKGTNFFVFPYDWRKDVRETKDGLDSLIEEAKTKSGQTKVNVVAHSMGGLVARYYISESSKASKIDKLIELGVPHLGATSSLKTLMYGTALEKNAFGVIPLGLPSSEVNDIYKNLPSGFQLLPSKKYYDFYKNSDIATPFPFKDDRDIDNNSIKGSLNYDQTKDLLKNLNHNQTIFTMAEQFHDSLDSNFSNSNGVKIHQITGSNQPTLGQIQETWLIKWPTNLIEKRDQIYVNGDGTVPIYSATLKSDSLDLSGAQKIYYTEQEHSNLVSSSGTAMQTVKSILNEITLPVEVKDQKITLEGKQISVDQDTNLDIYDSSNNHTGINSNGDVETNIPGTFFDSLGNTKHIFIKKSSSKVTVKITTKTSTKADVKIRTYSSDSVSKTAFYNDVSVTPTSFVQFTLDPTTTSAPTLTAGTQSVTTTSEISGSPALDQTPPITTASLSGTKNSSGIYDSSGVKITLTSSDSESGLLKIEYSLDNGTTVNTYTDPFTITSSGKYTLLVKSIDNLGNEEKTQTFNFEIAAAVASSSSSSSTNSSSSSSSDSSSNLSSSNSPNSSTNKISIPENIIVSKILADSFQNPIESKTELSKGEILGTQSIINSPEPQSESQKILNIVLITSAGVVTIASIALGTTFVAGGSLTGASTIAWIKGIFKIFF